MGYRPWSLVRSLVVIPLFSLILLSEAVILSELFVPAASAAPKSEKTLTPQTGTGQPIHITADRIEYFRNTETYEAEGKVVAQQGPMRLTADHVTIYMLTGTAVAVGHAYLTDQTSDLWADRLELNLNTDAGVITDGKLYIRDTNTFVTGRLLQRFSEDHFRAKDGSFTNCDAKEGQIPAWRFKFEDVDINAGDRLYGKGVVFCVNDRPLIKLPVFAFPMQTARKSGFLVPTAGYDNRFGLHYRQGFYWVINPSQDATITPDYLSNRGYGGDLEYRYILDRNSRGQWLATFIEDTTIGRGRALLTGSHLQKVNPDLQIRARANLLSDPNYYRDLSNSGVLRALPSQESNLDIIQRFHTGNLYLLGQYLQPLGVGGKGTFQRMPEIGHRLLNVSPVDAPVLLSMDSTLVNFYRDIGFNNHRVDLVPSVATDLLNIDHVAGFMPQFKFREVYYTHGAINAKPTHREVFWGAFEGFSRLARRYQTGGDTSLLHTIEPHFIYEYVPPTDQSDIPQVDDVDDLPKKSLLTYKIRNRLLGRDSKGNATNWLDLTLAQSYHVGTPPTTVRQFFFPGNPLFETQSQPIQPPTIPVNTRKFSDIWARAVVGWPSGLMPGLSQASALTIDAFYDPYRGEFSQWNTDARYQHHQTWYVEVGQRYTRDGNRPRRGDIWNPISFNEVFAPTDSVRFATLAGGARTPWGWTIGAKTYYDLKSGIRSETDLVGVYQNPCRCWSLGLFYIQFPDRVQYNFLLSLAGLVATESFGTLVIKSILGPLLAGERGLPWPTPYTKRTPTAGPMPEAPPNVLTR